MLKKEGMLKLDMGPELNATIPTSLRRQITKEKINVEKGHECLKETAC